MSKKPRQQAPPMIKQDLTSTPAEENQTEKLVVFLTTEVNDKIEQKAYEMFGKRKGAVSLYVEQAMRVHLHMRVPGVEER